jgi:hypothetical protein
MLPAAMRRIPSIALCLLAAILVAGALGACGNDEEETQVAEGEPLELGGLSYNVQLTRFLNPDDPEDAEYLVDQPAPKPETYYLGVFMVVGNESDEPLPSAGSYTVIDTINTQYKPLPTDSPYALDVGTEVPAEGELPLPDTTAQTGPNEGSLLIFRVEDDVSENRPLRLKISGPSGTGEVLLDI